MVHKKRFGVLVILLASVMWALEPIFAKLSYSSSDFLNTFASRTIFCFVTITIYLVITRRDGFVVEKHRLPYLIYISLAATLFADLLYIYALTRVAVLNAVLIGHMQPIFVVVLGLFLYREEKVTHYDSYGIACMIIAGILVTTRTVHNLAAFRLGSMGDLYVLMATILWASTALVARKHVRGLYAGTIAFYRYLFGGSIFIVYMILMRGIQINTVYQVFIGIAVGIGTILYYEGIRLIKAAQVAALELATPFFAAVLGLVVLREYVSGLQLVGMLFLLGGIYFLAKKEAI